LFNLDCNFKHPAADVSRPLTPGGLIEKMAGKAGMPAWPIVRAEAIRHDVLEAENRRPALSRVGLRARGGRHPARVTTKGA